MTLNSYVSMNMDGCVDPNTHIHLVLYHPIPKYPLTFAGMTRLLKKRVVYSHM